jgi:hypothetical protein
VVIRLAVLPFAFFYLKGTARRALAGAAMLVAGWAKINEHKDYDFLIIDRRPLREAKARTRHHLSAYRQRSVIAIKAVALLS